MTLTFKVHGRPQTAGSKRAFPYRKKGGDKLGVRVSDDNPKARAWKDHVAWCAREAMGQRGPLDGPLELALKLSFRRPKGHYKPGSGYTALSKKGAASPWPTVKPDATKCLRAIEDALTDAGVWWDDAQVVRQVVEKAYALEESAEVTVRRLEPGTTLGVA